LHQWHGGSAVQALRQTRSGERELSAHVIICVAQKDVRTCSLLNFHQRGWTLGWPPSALRVTVSNPSRRCGVQLCVQALDARAGRGARCTSDV